MKKLATLAALAALALPVIATEVTSSNVVGYTKVSLDAGYNMIGVQFQNIGTQTAAITTLGKLDSSFAGYDDAYDFPTQMRVWNGVGYDYYGWAGTSGTEVDNDSTLDNTWTDLEAYAVTDTLKPGDGVWIVAEKAGTITLSGEVPSMTSGPITYNLSAGYNIVANPYPYAVPVTSFGTLDSSFAGYDDAYDFPTQMRVWNGVGYDYYGWAGTSGTEVDNDSTLDNTWTDLEAYAVDAQIGVGEAVWILAEKAGTITFQAPQASAGN